MLIFYEHTQNTYIQMTSLRYNHDFDLKRNSFMQVQMHEKPLSLSHTHSSLKTDQNKKERREFRSIHEYTALSFQHDILTRKPH